MKMLWVFCFGFWVSGFAQGNLILDGGFENPVVSGVALNLSGAFTFGAWSGVAASVGGNAGVVRGSTGGLDPLEGLQHFTFNGGNPGLGGYIEQSFATTVGEVYTLRFGLGRAGAAGQNLNGRVSVFSGDFGAGAFVLDEVATPDFTIGYTTFSYQFTAGAGVSTLRFTDFSGLNQVSDLYLDGVSVTHFAPVTELATWQMILGAVGVWVGCSRWRRRTADVKRREARMLLWR